MEAESGGIFRRLKRRANAHLPLRELEEDARQIDRQLLRNLV